MYVYANSPPFFEKRLNSPKLTQSTWHGIFNFKNCSKTIKSYLLDVNFYKGIKACGSERKGYWWLWWMGKIHGTHLLSSKVYSGLGGGSRDRVTFLLLKLILTFLKNRRS